jgi:hypothetical protein
VSAGTGPSAAMPRAQRGLDHVDLLAAEMAALAAVRVETRDQNSRARDPETLPQIVFDHAQCVDQAGARDRARDVRQRQMRGGERHAQSAADEHHDHVRRLGARGEVLGVAGEREPGVVYHRLVHRRRYHRVELARKATLRCAI